MTSKNYEERNKNQKKVVITLNNVDKFFSNNTTELLCYNKIFNLCQKYTTQYMKFTTDFELKKELSYITLYKLYVHFKKALDDLQNEGKEPKLEFYLSQFYYYVNLAARNTVFVYSNKQKNSPQFIEFRSEVDYNQPIEEYLEDVEKYIPIKEKFILQSNDYNNKNKKYDDFNQHENMLEFERLTLRLKTYLSEDEIKIIEAIHDGEDEIDKQKLQIIKDKIKENKDLEELLKETL